MPVSYGQNCSHIRFKPYTYLTYLSHETYSRKYEKLPNCRYPCMLKYYRKYEFVENVWPSNSALFIYV